MSDPFERAARQVERERLLTEHPPSATPAAEAPLEPPTSLPDADLVRANELFDPTRLPAGARALPAKRFLLRILNLYTTGQVLFNAALVRIVNDLPRVVREMARRDAVVDERAARRAALVEERVALAGERRAVWEARFTADLAAAEDRVSELESREAESRDDRRALLERLERLEAAQRQLEAEVEALRRGAGAGSRVA